MVWAVKGNEHRLPETTRASSFEIVFPKADGLSDEAARTFQSRVQKFADEVFGEASLYEFAHRRDASEVPQFTSAHFADADDAVRRRHGIPSLKRSSNWIVVGSRIGLYLTAAGVGLGASAIREQWGLGVFIASLVAGLFLVAIIELSPRKSD